MAGIRKKGDAYYCTFRFQGKRYYFTVGSISEAQALAKGTEVDETLNLIERGRLTVPDGVPLEEFVAAGGRAPVVVERQETLTVRNLFDRYLTTLGNGTIEEKSLITLRSHLKQVGKTLGDRFRIQGLTLADLQGHVDRRAKKGLSPVTSKKEIASFRACWNWAVHGGLLKGAFPNRGLRFPKEEEKEPFRTFTEIETAIAVENPDDDRRDSLWEALYLTRTEIEEFLEYMRTHCSQPWVYPMVVFAAYTGARRSEMMRALTTDLDLTGGVVTIRERKRVKGKRSNRLAPITPKLAKVLREWLAVKPVSPYLFCQSQHVAFSGTKREGPTPITMGEAYHHFNQSVDGSKWEVLRGYHVLRHSFISALASQGVDQRVIDEVVGHQSEEQRKRYRHLYPGVMREAIKGVFG